MNIHKKTDHQASLKEKKTQAEIDEIQAKTDKLHAETLSIYGKILLSISSIFALFGISRGPIIGPPISQHEAANVARISRTERDVRSVIIRLMADNQDRLMADIDKIMEEGNASIKNGEDLITVNNSMINDINFLRKTYTTEQDEEIIDAAIQLIQLPSSKYV